MRKEELRIGNIIDFEGMYCEVQEIDKQGIVVFIKDTQENVWIDLFQFTPIPLTEEILLKCGFAARGWFWFDLHLDEKTKLTLGWHPDGRIDFEISINKIYFDISHVKYLHQLQNLYWALCGKELECILY